MKAEEFIISTGNGKLYSNELEVETATGTKTYEEIIITDDVVMEGTLTVAGTLVKKVTKIFAGVLTVGGTFVKIAKMTIEGTLTVSGALTSFITKWFPRNLRRVILLIRDKK